LAWFLTILDFCPIAIVNVYNFEQNKSVDKELYTKSFFVYFCKRKNLKYLLFIVKTRLHQKSIYFGQFVYPRIRIKCCRLRQNRSKFRSDPNRSGLFIERDIVLWMKSPRLHGKIAVVYLVYTVCVVLFTSHLYCCFRFEKSNYCVDIRTFLRPACR
jgi:hypothetical protein